MGHAQVIDLTAENFTDEVLEAHQPTLVDFCAPWCGPCGTMSPMVVAVAEIFANYLKVGKVRVDGDPELAARYDVTNSPTLKLFSEGKVVKTWVGAQTEKAFGRELADELLRQHAKPILREFAQRLRVPQEVASRCRGQGPVLA